MGLRERAPLIIIEQEGEKPLKKLLKKVDVEGRPPLVYTVIRKNLKMFKVEPGSAFVCIRLHAFPLIAGVSAAGRKVGLGFNRSGIQVIIRRLLLDHVADVFYMGQNHSILFYCVYHNFNEGAAFLLQGYKDQLSVDHYSATDRPVSMITFFASKFNVAHFAIVRPLRCILPRHSGERRLLPLW